MFFAPLAPLRFIFMYFHTGTVSWRTGTSVPAGMTSTPLASAMVSSYWISNVG
jgi:hypothetical protein